MALFVFTFLHYPKYLLYAVMTLIQMDMITIIQLHVSEIT